MEKPQDQQEKQLKWLDKDNIKLVKGLFNAILDSETSPDGWRSAKIMVSTKGRTIKPI